MTWQLFTIIICRHAPLVTLAVKHRPSSREFLFDPDHRLCGWHNNVTGETKWAKEIADPLKIAFSTAHVIDPRLFELVTETGAFSLTDLYLRLAERNVILGFEHNETIGSNSEELKTLKA